jgi:hypothetical protein
MKLSRKKVIKMLLSGTLALPAGLLLFLGSMFIHLKLYKYLNPSAVTEMGHNINFDRQVEVHFFIAVPLFYFLCTWLIFRVLSKRGKNA